MAAVGFANRPKSHDSLLIAVSKLQFEAYEVIRRSHNARQATLVAPPQLAILTILSALTIPTQALYFYLESSSPNASMKSSPKTPS